MTGTRDFGRRWKKLDSLVRQQFSQHKQDPNVFQGDRTSLKLRAIVPGTYPPEWFSVTLDEEAVLKGDLLVIATQFYAEYRADIDPHSQ